MGSLSFLKAFLLVAAAIMAIVLLGSPGATPFNETHNITPVPTFLPNHNETIRIGAFNIQVFGVTKAAKPDVMDILSKIIRTYDIVAIEEIRDSTETALPILMNYVNIGDSQYTYVVSERLGRTSSKEQYAYIYNTAKVTLTDIPETYPEPEGTDPFHRQPFIASFKANEGNFDATFLIIHTDPDSATEEINALEEAVIYAKSTHPFEDDFIVMGDLNADGTYFDEDGPSTMKAEEYVWVIDNSIDTTTGSNTYTYDRIIVNQPVLSVYTGASGVYRFDTEYNLTNTETIAVSDHYPIYMDVYVNSFDN